LLAIRLDVDHFRITHKTTRSAFCNCLPRLAHQLPSAARDLADVLAKFHEAIVNLVDEYLTDCLQPQLDTRLAKFDTLLG